MSEHSTISDGLKRERVALYVRVSAAASVLGQVQ